MTKASMIGNTNSENVLGLMSASAIDNASPLKCTPPVISTLIGKEDYDSSATVSLCCTQNRVCKPHTCIIMSSSSVDKSFKNHHLYISPKSLK